MYVKVNTLPQHLQAKLSEVGFHGRDVSIEPKESVSVQDFGGAGRRAFFFPFSLDPAQGCGATVYGSWGGPNPFETRQPDADNRDHAIPPGCGVARVRMAARATCTRRSTFIPRPSRRFCPPCRPSRIATSRS